MLDNGLHQLLLPLPGRPHLGHLGQQLRAEGIAAPMIYLTARGTVEDRVEGLEAGGDDYLVKPFAFRELRARIRALLRRAGGNAQNALTLPHGWVMDLGGRELHRAGVRADLTRREFALLELLALHPGRAFTRDEIIERLWSGDGCCTATGEEEGQGGS